MATSTTGFVSLGTTSTSMTVDSTALTGSGGITFVTDVVEDKEAIAKKAKEEESIQSKIGENNKPSYHYQYKKLINPRLYFKFIKNKVQHYSEEEKKFLKKKIRKLSALLNQTKTLGQQALYEEYAKQITILVREFECEALGFGRWVMEEDVKKFLDKVANVKMKDLAEYPRQIPVEPRDKIKKAQDSNLFDEYFVVYTSYSNDEIKSNKEKIREKDPICFGRFAYNPERFYFIADWIDEYCDITLDKFIETLKEDDEDYDLNVPEELDCDFLANLKQEVKDRHERLSNTKPSNYRGLMAEEDKANEEKPEIKKENKKGFWSKLFLWNR